MTRKPVVTEIDPRRVVTQARHEHFAAWLLLGLGPEARRWIAVLPRWPGGDESKTLTASVGWFHMHPSGPAGDVSVPMPTLRMEYDDGRAPVGYRCIECGDELRFVL